MPRLEQPDLFVDVVALCGSGRADDDESGRGVQRGERLLRERMARGEVVAVAEDGLQRCGDRARRGLAAGEILVDGEGFERAMQPLGPRGIGVAVGDEGAVFEGDRLCHGLTTDR